MQRNACISQFYYFVVNMSVLRSRPKSKPEYRISHQEGNTSMDFSSI